MGGWIYVFKDGIKSRKRNMIIATIQSKGGVAKTTSSVNLAHALVMEGKKTLVIDFDSQGSASLSLGIPRSELSPSLAEVLLEDLPIEEAVRETSIENLYIITGTMALANFDVAMSNRAGRESIFKEVIKSISHEYDYVILDCPPSLGLLPINALVACHHYLIPSIPHYLAMEGMVNLIDAIDRVKAGIGAQCSLLGILLTLVDGRPTATKEVVDMIRQQFSSAVFNTEIKQNIRLAEAPSHGKTIFQHDWSSSGAQAYQSLAKEVLERTGHTPQKLKAKNEKRKTVKVRKKS
jgi:chromosome partitioning protein